MNEIAKVLWGDTPYFENDKGTLMAATPAMAYWMIRTMLWLIED